MDTVDLAAVDLVGRTVAAIVGVLGAGEMMMRWIGRTLRAEFFVTVDASLTVERARCIARGVERELVHSAAPAGRHHRPHRTCQHC